MMTRHLSLLIVAAALAGCSDPLLGGVPQANPPPALTACVDADGDGYGAGGQCAGPDCNDADPRIHPGAPDTVGDGIDENCDGVDGVDADGDGHASIASGGDDCNDADASTYPGAPDTGANGADHNCDGVPGVDADHDGYASRLSGGTDCDDTDPAIKPGAPDTVGDGIDENCDGVDGIDADGDGHASLASGGDDCDDNDPNTFAGAASADSTTACMTDADHDHHGDASPANPLVVRGTDCDDADPKVYGGAAYHDSTTLCMRDADGDGWGDPQPPAGVTAGTDCDDTQPALHLALAVYDDADGDGFGVGTATILCTGGTPPAGKALAGGDCDETSSRTFPGAALRDSATACMKDADGDGYGDAAPPAGVTAGSDCDDTQAAVYHTILVYTDADGDGFGVGTGTPRCIGATPPANLATRTGDCDDASARTFPGAAPKDSATACMKDADGDGYGDASATGTVTPGSDCDDAAARTFPGAAPKDSSTACMKDVDGDGWGDKAPPAGVTAGTDCDDTSVVTYKGAATKDDAAACMKDTDGDGYGDASPPAGVTAGTDCNDANASVHKSLTGYVDADLDGFGAGSAQVLCTAGSLPAGYAATNTDCDDKSAVTHPGIATLETSPTACMKDADGDHYGDASPPPGVTAGTDCDDTNATLHKGLTGYLDADGDGYGAGPATPMCTSGSLPAGWALNSLDCDDNSAVTYPGAANADGFGCMKDADHDHYGDASPPPGVTAGTDCNDADASVHRKTTGYVDADGDGYGTGTSVNLCAPSVGLPAGYSTNNTDCNDADKTVFTSMQGYLDADKDGYGVGSQLTLCTAGSLPAGYSTNNTDCDDGNGTIHPGATEHDDGVDEDCNGDRLELALFDADGDGFTAGYGSATVAIPDCDDGNPSIYPGATEHDDGIDEDCDGDRIELGLFDLDGDGWTRDYGNLTANLPDCDDTDPRTYPGAAGKDSTTACMRDRDGDGYGASVVPAGITAGTDCADNDAWSYPGGFEIPDDGVDNDCAGGDLQAATSSTPCFVDAVGGSDTTGDGTRAKPYQSLAKVLPPLSYACIDVFIGGGTYTGNFTAGGRNLYGGYDPASWTRDLAGHPTRLTSAGVTVSGTGVTLQGLTVDSTSGTSTMTVSLTSGTDSRIFDCAIKGSNTPGATQTTAIQAADPSAFGLTLVRSQVTGGVGSSSAYGVSVTSNGSRKLRIDRCTIDGGGTAGSGFSAAVYTQGASAEITTSRLGGGVAAQSTAAYLGCVGYAVCAHVLVDDVLSGGSGATSVALDLWPATNSQFSAAIVHDTIFVGSGATAARGVRILNNSAKVYLVNSVVTATATNTAIMLDSWMDKSSGSDVVFVGNDLYPGTNGCSYQTYDGGCLTVASLNSCSTCTETHDNIAGDPKLASTAAGDPHLQAGSAAYGTGVMMKPLWYSGPFTAFDLDGEPRPQVIRPDIGADQHVSLGTVAASALTVNSGSPVAAGGGAYPLTFSYANATSYKVTVGRVSGTGSLATVSPNLGLLAPTTGTAALTFTAGGLAGDKMRVTVTVYGPDGQATTTLDITQT